MTDDTERRAPVQGTGRYWLPSGDQYRDAKPPGTIAWSEHVEAWEEYARRYGHDQSAERIAERHGFGWDELCELLGREPTTWRPRP